MLVKTITIILMLITFGGVRAQVDIVVSTEELDWQQADSTQSFIAFVERETFSTLDREGRIVFAVQQGQKTTLNLSEMSVKWQVLNKETVVAEGSASLKKGMGVVNLNLEPLKPGEYEMKADFIQRRNVIKTIKSPFWIVEKAMPQQTGRVPLVLTKGIPLVTGTYPVSCGIPFPKGAIFDKSHVRVVTADGDVIPSQTFVRSRWGRSKLSSIRWLGVDFQASKTVAWWPNQKSVGYYLEFGPEVKPVQAAYKVNLQKINGGYRVDTGPLQFDVTSTTFNLLSNVKLNGKKVLGDGSRYGLFLKDHKGAVYRAANDRNVTLSIEESGDLKVIICAEGWYVKDGSNGSVLNYTSATDRLCKFKCRLEAYAGKPYVRILNSTIITYDSYTVRLRDLGISLPLVKAERAVFGIENSNNVFKPVPADGVYLIQHLPHQFNIENGGGELLATGKHSAGWFSAQTKAGVITATLREAWQRYPKEFEVKPDKLIVHLWPAHGKEHPEINDVAHKHIHKLLFAHQGKELNLAMPWRYYLAVANISDSEQTGVYCECGQALAGVHSSAMGAAITSDVLLDFNRGEGAVVESQEVAECFEKVPTVMAEPKWNCASSAAGWIHHYDPQNFPVIEKIIYNLMRGYWKTGDITDEYGMWLYRRWHHSNYLGDGKWNLYRLNNTTHHYEAFLPWLLYLRSGDPFYLTQGLAHMRNMTDVGMIHYDDPDYPHHEFHFRQKRLVGSTKHTNGFNTWGADHGIGGHLTCYNGILLAYYMTGDRRFLDSVNEWHNTLVNDRLNPNYKPADRSQKADGSIKKSINSARDLGNHLGELIDLYQFNYDPKVLALIAPRYNVFVNNVSSNWGLPMQNVLHFSGSRTFRNNLLDAVSEYRRTLGKDLNDPHIFWYNHTPYNNFSLAEIVAPGNNYYMDALLKAQLPNRLNWSEKYYNPEIGREAFHMLPDYALYLPTLMYASEGKSRKNLKQSQPYPVGKTLCILKEDVDQDIVLTLFGESKADVVITVYNPENKKIMAEKIAAGIYNPRQISIPKDQLTGQYAIRLQTKEHLAKIKVPLSRLPEVYYSTYWSQFAPSRFFIKSADGGSDTLIVKPLSRPGNVVAAGSGETLAVSKKGESMKAVIPASGAWLATDARYVSLNNYFVLSVSPELWFMPDNNKLKLK